jgi:hypothetical protein
LVVQGKGFRAISCSHFVRPLLLRGGSWDYDFTAQHFLEQDVAAYALTRFGSGLGSSDSEVAAVSSGLLERPWIGSDCPSLDAVQLEPGILTTLSVQSSNDFRYVRLRADKGGIVRISRAVSGLVVCNSCDTAPSQCLPVLARNEEFAIDGEAVLALQGTPGPGLSTLELQLVGAMMPESGSQGADPSEDDAPGDHHSFRRAHLEKCLQRAS